MRGTESSTNDFYFHTPHGTKHGLIHGMRMDVTGLMAMEMLVADMTPGQSGDVAVPLSRPFHTQRDGGALRRAVGG